MVSLKIQALKAQRFKKNVNSNNQGNVTNTHQSYDVEYIYQMMLQNLQSLCTVRPKLSTRIVS